MNNQDVYLSLPNKVKQTKGAVVLLGGTGGYVRRGETDLHQKSERMKFVRELNEQGYVVGYSNAHNRNWGSSKAIADIRALYKVIKEKYHVSSVLHVIGISMGSILGLRLAAKQVLPMTSLTLIKPVMDLRTHRHYIYKQEKQDRIGEELAKAYDIPLSKVDQYIANWELRTEEFPDIPCQIYCGANDKLAPLKNNILPFTKISIDSNEPTQLTVVEKAAHQDDHRFFRFKNEMLSFFKQNEKVLNR